MAAIQIIFDGTDIFNDTDPFVRRKNEKAKMQITQLFAFNGGRWLKYYVYIVSRRKHELR
jgi:hypothetical protein